MNLILSIIFRFFTSVLLILLMPLLALVALFIKISSKGPILHWSMRVGKNNKIFLMPKFRTMKINTPDVATHLLQNHLEYTFPFGAFLRKTSIDEIPQLISIIQGKMSLVGPRPALYNQYDLIKLREKNNIHLLKPGITGWAQVNGRDDISIEKKVSFEKEYLDKKSLQFDIYILFLTIINVLSRKNINH